MISVDFLLLVTRNLIFFSMIPIGATPLGYAIYGGIVDTVSYLLDHGANPDKPNEKGCTPLHLAVEQGPSQCISFILYVHGCTTLFFILFFIVRRTANNESCKKCRLSIINLE